MNQVSEELRQELAMLRDNARRFVEREVVPNRDRWRHQGCVDVELWHKAGQAGLLCTGIPVEYGGGGGSFRHEAIVIEEISRVGFPDFASSMHSAIVAPYVLHCGTAEQRQRWLPGLASGERIGALAMTEPSTGSDLKAIRTTARLDGDAYVISGQKTFITNGQLANFIIVACKTDVAAGAKGISLIAVETDRVSGFRRGRNLEKIGWKAQDTSELFFDEVRVPASNLIGGVANRGFFQMMEQLPQERLVVGVQAVAAMESALEWTLAYARERKAFGQTVFDFQNTRFKLAEVKTETRIARVFLEHCIDELVEGRLDATTAAMVKWWTSQKQCEITDECLQFFGGYGYMAEYPIAHLWADARLQKIYAGTNEIMKELISRSL